MKRIITTALFILLSQASFGQKSVNDKVIYKYKKFEKFNLDEISVDGELGAPGEITVSSRYLRQFKNKLPSKPNFHLEMMKGLDRIR
ncbi:MULTISPECIES: hypothetical protein [Halobacteriovorax]|uniref:Uncharacterized protein n=1 Tax=Halobacteriovorax vibrionivorans TaxID=2152716 RepID=A0ABY0IJW3_9BACT|nr:MULTISPECIES: hypothetical protein [Halobacteriovorax]AYF43299.1 hypothetical protein BALOs_0284 [Halobacteriovorax sp. BALOs_7]RZF22126.1 hypothetical protein DAY19_10615 [Halobacteriovorax vibrionivorans]TGD47174.1 hypothetical protein EP118_09200 [Halobacteriovorax sp. Y22]